MSPPAPHILLLVAIGVAIILANWLPRLISGREPAASALLIGAGALLFLVPGMPAAPDPVRDPRPWEWASEVCVVIGLFGVGLRIDSLATVRRWGPTLRLLLIAMPLTIAAVAALGWWLGGLTLAGALLLGALLAPTDPVLASDVQVGPPLEGGEHPVRFALTAEAGLNDGLAFPFVHLALAVAAAGLIDAPLLIDWAWHDLLLKVALGVAGGVGVGWLLARLVFVVPKDNPLAATEAGIVALAGALAAYGLTEVIHGYGFIAAFVSGITLRRIEARHQFNRRLHDFAESIERALTALLLLALGAVMPGLLAHLDLAGAAIAATLVLVVRPLVGLLSLWGTDLRQRERVVVAFYGIRGIGSIYYLSYGLAHMAMLDAAPLWAITGFTILLSTIVHGFTAGAAMDRATRPPGNPPPAAPATG